MICQLYGCTPDVAMQQDYDMALEHLVMRAYDAVLSKEESGQKLVSADYRIIIPIERAAGVTGARAVEVTK